MDLTERLDAMEAAIRKPSFRQSSGKANEVNYWIFDYPPEKELEVRECPLPAKIDRKKVKKTE